MKKIISFTLYGDNPKYTIGAIKNAKLTPFIYPGWISRFYIGQSVPKYIIDELKNINNIEIVHMHKKGDFLSTFWRFLACTDNDVEIMISRDVDSRLNNREAEAVKEWIKSNKDFHIMRDHPSHKAKILAGMWGCRASILRDMKILIDKYVKKINKYGVDQEFLKDIIYPKFKDNSFIHDEFYGKNKFPTKRIGLEYVGQVFDENDNTPKRYLKSLKKRLMIQVIKDQPENLNIYYLISLLLINFDKVRGVIIYGLRLFLKRKLSIKKLLINSFYNLYRTVFNKSRKQRPKRKIPLKTLLLKKFFTIFFQ